MFGVVPSTQALYYTHYFNVNMKRRGKNKNLMLNLVDWICVGSKISCFVSFIQIQIQMRHPYFILLECISDLKVKKILLECWKVGVTQRSSNAAPPQQNLGTKDHLKTSVMFIVQCKCWCVEDFQLRIL